MKPLFGETLIGETKGHMDPSHAKVLIVGGCDLIRSGLRYLLGKTAFIVGVEECSALSAFEAHGAEHWDVVIIVIDATNAEWDSTVEPLLRESAQSRVVVLTDCQAAEHVRALYAAGAIAVVQKDQSSETIIAAIQAAAKGNIWVHRSALLSVLEAESGDRYRSPEARKVSTLTHREREIIQTIAKGYRNKQIAAELCVSEATVRHHLSSIFSKLGVSDRLELLIYVQKHGLLQRPVEKQFEVTFPPTPSVHSE